MFRAFLVAMLLSACSGSVGSVAPSPLQSHYPADSEHTAVLTGVSEVSLAMDASAVYALGHSHLFRLDCATGAVSLLATGPWAGAIAVDADGVYAGTTTEFAVGDDQIVRVAKTGGAPTPLITKVWQWTGVRALDLATDHGRVVGSWFYGFFSVPTTGGEMVASPFEQDGYTGLLAQAPQGAYLAWDAKTLELGDTSWTTLGAMDALAADEAGAYWATASGPDHARIGMVPVAGDPLWLGSCPIDSMHFAANALGFYWVTQAGDIAACTRTPNGGVLQPGWLVRPESLASMVLADDAGLVWVEDPGTGSLEVHVRAAR